EHPERLLEAVLAEPETSQCPGDAAGHDEQTRDGVPHGDGASRRARVHDLPAAYHHIRSERCPDERTDDRAVPAAEEPADKNSGQQTEQQAPATEMQPVADPRRSCCGTRR